MDFGLEDATRRWVAGWAHTRGVGTGVVAGWPIVHLRSETRAFELVCAEPDVDTWEILLDDIAGDRTAMLTLASADPSPYLATLPAGVRVEREDEVLMVREGLNSQGIEGNSLDTLGIARPGVTDVTAYDVERVAGDGRLLVRLTRDERVAAEGCAGVLGHDAVFDRVETTPAYRRQGLADWVMGELTAWAVDQGATDGLLAASAEGAAMYRTLGWRDLAPLRSLRGAP